MGVGVSDGLRWDGDNAGFVVEMLLPSLVGLSERTRQVIRWAYGYDGADRSYEGESDGSSVVPDLFLGGKIKEPFGVGHDYLWILHDEGRPTPDGVYWTWWETNVWYWRAVREFGFPFRASGRFLGLALFSWPVWLRHNKEMRR